MSEYMKARPTMYKGVKMRSRLEAGFARWLDGFPWVSWVYEPQAFASSRGQYLPDFRAYGFRMAWADGQREVYFEVKPSIFGWRSEWDEDAGTTPEQEAGYETEQALWRRMSIIWESEPEVLLCLVKSRKDAPWADFWIADPLEDGIDNVRPVDLVQGCPGGMVPAFADIDGPVVPPWPPRYWEST